MDYQLRTLGMDYQRHARDNRECLIKLELLQYVKIGLTGGYPVIHEHVKSSYFENGHRIRPVSSNSDCHNDIRTGLRKRLRYSLAPLTEFVYKVPTYQLPEVF